MLGDPEGPHQTGWLQFWSLAEERVKGLRVKVVTLQREPKGAVTHPFGQEKAERKYS